MLRVRIGGPRRRAVVAAVPAPGGFFYLSAFETRANVMKAMQGHVLGKAVYGGLFKRPQ